MLVGDLGKRAVLIVILVIVTSGASAQQITESASLDNLKHTVTILASPAYSGRRYDQQGGDKASLWIQQQLDDMDLTPPVFGRTQTFGSVENILAFIPGSDPDETVVIGAHYDHLGIRFDAIHPGADDNASGVAAVLEIARIVKASDAIFKRNLLFVFFDGEEPGKLGSKQLLERSGEVLGDSRIVFMMNFDMVGRLRNGKLKLSGFSTLPLIDGWVTNAAQHTSKLDIRRFSGVKLISDEAAFVAYGIPVLKFFTGSHSDYHSADDVPDKINYPGLREVAKLGAHIALSAALEEQKLIQHVTPGHARSKYARYKLGIESQDGITPDKR